MKTKSPSLNILVIGNFSPEEPDLINKLIEENIACSINTIEEGAQGKIRLDIFAPKEFCAHYNKSGLIEKMKIDLTLHRFTHRYFSISDALMIHECMKAHNHKKVVLAGKSKAKSEKEFRDIKHDSYRAFLSILYDIAELPIIMSGDFLMDEIQKDPKINKSKWVIKEE